MSMEMNEGARRANDILHQQRLERKLDAINSPAIELRDFFAAQAIHCFTLNDVEVTKLLSGGWPRHDLVAEFCYRLADAMLRERAKTEQHTS